MEKKYSCANYAPFKEKVAMVLCSTCKKYPDCYDMVEHVYRLYKEW
jgi:hypothetical protein